MSKLTENQKRTVVIDLLNERLSHGDGILDWNASTIARSLLIEDGMENENPDELIPYVSDWLENKRNIKGARLTLLKELEENNEVGVYSLYKDHGYMPHHVGLAIKELEKEGLVEMVDEDRVKKVDNS